MQSSLSGTDCLTRPQVSPGDLEAAGYWDLRTQISGLVEALWQDGEADCRAVAGKAVLAAAKEQILRGARLVRAAGLGCGYLCHSRD